MSKVMDLTENLSKWGLMTVLESVPTARMMAESKMGAVSHDIPDLQAIAK
jgi:hypothetical protein